MEEGNIRELIDHWSDIHIDDQGKKGNYAKLPLMYNNYAYKVHFDLSANTLLRIQR